jgi:membrane protein involved in colicin uptake
MAAFTSIMMGIAAAASAASVGMAYKNGQDQKEASAKAVAQQEAAQKQAQANADKTAAEADQANNKANQKSPDTSAILSAASQSGKGGASGTMLTGAQGVDPNLLNLGKNTLLGA